MKHDALADVFCLIKNMEGIGRKECVTPASNVIKGVLEIMHKHKYIGGIELIKDGKGNKFKVQLLGKINNCNVVRPRFSIRKEDIIKWEKKYLPASNIGILILTTPKGIMDQNQARKEKTGGKLLGYVY